MACPRGVVAGTKGGRGDAGVLRIEIGMDVCKFECDDDPRAFDSQLLLVGFEWQSTEMIHVIPSVQC